MLKCRKQPRAKQIYDNDRIQMFVAFLIFANFIVCMPLVHSIHSILLCDHHPSFTQFPHVTVTLALVSFS